VLVERDELTSGSTWHAAAQVTQFGGNQTMIALKQHSIRLYRELAADPDHPISYHITGGMRTAYNQAQLDTYHHYVSQARSMGVEMEVIDGVEAGKRHPLLETSGILGAWWDPLDGDIDPAGITFALARKARLKGCTVSRFNPVTAITRLGDRDFIVHTERGDIRTENVVNAGGYRCNEVGAMLGVTHPVVSMEHMYFLTEAIPALEALGSRVPIIRDPADDFYSRQEKHGLLVGVYEQDCVPFGLDGIDPDFTKALCPSDLDRCLDNMERIFERMPCLQETGIHTVVNGPITYTIDGLPLVGPVPGEPGYFACTGLRAGIGEGGGHGKVLAEIMVHGECEWDAWSLDPRRFTEWGNLEHTRLKAIEDYQREFHYHLPHEHRPAARLARTTPLYQTLSDAGAVWGVVNGWERALYFDPAETTAHGTGYRWHAQDAIARDEVLHLVDNVGLMEVSGFNRMRVQGEGAAALLDRLVCGRIPSRVGRVSLCYLLNEHGHMLSEATIAKLGEDEFWFGSAAAAEWHDRDWLEANNREGVSITSLTDSHTTLVIAGARARELLSAISPREDWSGFGMMSARHALLGSVTATVMRISFSGELAYELHVGNGQLLQLWQTLVEKLVTLKLDGDGIAPAHGGASVWQGDTLVGSITSGGYGYRVQESIALAYVQPNVAAEGTALVVDVIGRPSTLADLHDFTRLIDALPNVSWFTRCCVATDLPDNFDLDRQTAYALLRNTGKPVGTSFTLAEYVDPIIDLFDYALGGEGEFRKRPFCKAHISPVISPLRYGEDAVEVAIACMRRGVIINNIVAAQSGATSPATPAGMLATTLAETLAALVMVNVFEPGYPMIFSNWPLVIDLRTGAFAGGGGEIALLNAASAQLSNHFGLPSGAACSMSDAKAIDAQMGMEKALSATAVGLSGCNMVYESSGMAASLLGASFEAFVLDNDMLGHVYRLMRGVEVNSDTLSLDAIREAVFGEGHFLGGQQTLDAMQRDYFYPKLADRDEPRTWALNSLWLPQLERGAGLVGAPSQGAMQCLGRCCGIVHRLCM